MNGSGRPGVLLAYPQRLVLGRTFASIGNLGILTLAGILQEQGFAAAAFTGIATDAMALIGRAGPGLFAVCFYCDFDNQDVVRSLAGETRRRGIAVVVGGPQTMHMTGADVERYRADAIIRGDAEESLPAYLAARLAGKRISLPEALEQAGDSAVYTLNDCTREYGVPDDNLAITADRRHRMMTVIGARGCPHRCAFCFEGGESKRLRQRNPDAIVAEVRSRLERGEGPRYVFFADDTFTVSPERTRRLLTGLARLRRDHDFVWFCEGHAGFFRRFPDVLPEMIASGMVRMQIGMESGVQAVLDAYGKGITPDDVLAVVQAANALGLPQLAGNFIIGGAFESPDTLAATTRFVGDLLAAAPGMLDVSTTFVMPLPGTALTTSPGRFGLTLEDPDYASSLEDYPVNATDSLTLQAVCMARSAFVMTVAATMREQYASGEIPSWRIAEDFRLARRYGLVSAHLRYLYAGDDTISAYYGTLAGTGLREWHEVDKGEAGRHIPVRVVPTQRLAALPVGDEDLSFLLRCGQHTLEELSEPGDGGIESTLARAARLAAGKMLLFADCRLGRKGA